MKNQISYEWCYEESDLHGDIINTDFADKLTDFAPDHEGVLVLVRNEGNEDAGVTDRFWAYVTHDKLPNWFADSTGNEIAIKVPERFKKELQAYLTTLTPKRNKSIEDMKRPELYQKTVDILVQAYLNDTLMHGNCYACAVGNIIAANKGYKYVPAIDEKYQRVVWDVTQGVYCNASGHGSWFDVINGCNYGDNGASEIESTGYSMREVYRIERAFEGAEEGQSKDEYMFNGLMAVIDVLDQIHENTDTEVTATQKKRFTTLPTNS